MKKSTAVVLFDPCVSLVSVRHDVESVQVILSVYVCV